MTSNGVKKSIKIIKKSPIVIVKNFILVELFAFGAYAISASLVYYAQIYRSLGLGKLIPFQVAQGIFIFVVETSLVFYVFLRWYKEYFQIDREKVAHAKGILYRQRLVVSLEKIASVTHEQGILGKLTKYGVVELKDASGRRLVKMANVPEPQELANLIMRYQRQGPKMASAVDANLSLAEVMSQNEHGRLEFKSTLRWDMREQKVNKSLEKSVMKTIAGFLNSQGGRLLIGVDDARRVVGLTGDFATLGKKNTDGFEIHFSHLFNNMIGAEFRRCVSIKWFNQEGRDVCLVSVEPAHRPVYLKDENNEEFYIRTGNNTTSLKFSEASAYIDSHWHANLI